MSLQEGFMSEKSGKNITVFGQETEFDGVLEFSDNLVITGKFHGTINATGDLEIEKSAVCSVDVMKAESIVVSGQVKGNIEARERIELCGGSKVSGDLKTARLRISDGVEFDGNVTMLEDTSTKDLFSVASDEFKKSLVIQSSEAR